MMLVLLLPIIIMNLNWYSKQYYSKAISSPFGQKVFSFYTSTTKQVRDIHEEARRIAGQHKATGSAPPHGADPSVATTTTAT